MAGLTITCGKCGAGVELTESLAAPLLEKARKDFSKRLAEKDREIERQTAEMDKRRKILEKAEEDMDATIVSRIAEERERLISADAKKAKAAVKADLDKKEQELQTAQLELKSTETELQKSRAAEAAFIKEKRELEKDKHSLELTVQQRVTDELERSRPAVREEIERETSLKLREKDIQLDAMKKQIEELRRKSEQGSQQLQGEALEQEISETLASKFPDDIIKRVPKGEFGGDCIHEVYSSQGKLCGTILWESKRTKDWNKTWIDKLKSDQRAAKADIAAIVSQALPKDVHTFDQVEELWVAGLDCLGRVHTNAIRIC